MLAPGAPVCLCWSRRYPCLSGLSSMGMSVAMPELAQRDNLTVVDPMDPTPYYVQVADVIRAQIKSGELGPGDRVPSENDIKRDHQVARETARKALAVLRDEGLIVTMPARGSFVAQRES